MFCESRNLFHISSLTMFDFKFGRSANSQTTVLILPHLSPADPTTIATKTISLLRCDHDSPHPPSNSAPYRQVQPQPLHNDLCVRKDPLALLVQRQQRLSVRYSKQTPHLSPHVISSGIIIHGKTDDFGSDTLSLCGCHEHWRRIEP